MKDRLAPHNGDHSMRLAVLVTVAAAAVSLIAVSPMLADPPSPPPVTAAPSSSPPATSATSPRTPASTQEAGVVSYVFDGDTLEVKQNGVTTRIRVLGINASEIAHDGKPAQCYGPEATTRARAAVLGIPVTLTSDPTQPATDRYGRQLRYVSVAGADLGQLLIAGGFAREYHLSSEGPTQQTGSYLGAQNTARSRRTGLWAACTSSSSSP